jgi:uncharacterized membrane protein (UPF0127 family)
MAWLVREGDVLASAEVAATRGARRRGLLGRSHLDGVLVLQPCRHVHTVGMRIPIDVAFCADDGTVLRTATLRPWRVSRYVPHAVFVVEAASGSFDRWHLRAGDVLEVKG